MTKGVVFTMKNQKLYFCLTLKPVTLLSYTKVLNGQILCIVAHLFITGLIILILAVDRILKATSK